MLYTKGSAGKGNQCKKEPNFMPKREYQPTLADKILATAVDPQMEYHSRGCAELAASYIKKGHRFVMSPEVRDAVRTLLTSRPSALLEALQWGRPPFDITWLEWPVQEQIEPIAAVRAKVERVGACVHILPGSDGTAFRFFTAWNHRPQDYEDRFNKLQQEAHNIPNAMKLLRDYKLANIGFSSMEIGVDLNAADGRSRYFSSNQWYKQHPQALTPERLKAQRDDIHNNIKFAIKDQNELEALIKIQNCVFWTTRNDPFSKESLRVSMLYGEQGIKAAMDDVRDEVGPVMALLVMMNARNCVEYERSPEITKLNKARRKNNKPEYVEHSIIRINFSRGQARAADAKGMTHEERKRHIVRGHFKTRRTGVYWWPAHLRGSADRGYVDQKIFVMDHPPTKGNPL